MTTRQYAVGGAAVLAMILLSVTAAAQTMSWTEALSTVDVVPRANQWALVDPQMHPVLKALVQMPAEERDRLIRSSSARERGLGLFVAEQQGDLAALLAAAPLLDDNELTIPYAVPVAQPFEYVQRDQTVTAYLTKLYADWFGVDVDKSRERFDRLLGDVSDPQQLVRPWIVRLRRAQDDAKQTAALKAEINALPEDVRWAVVTLGYQNSVLTLTEAHTSLANLSAATREAIQTRQDLLANEPLFRRNDGEFQKLVVEEARRLLKMTL